jgi:hypothetical protein
MRRETLLLIVAAILGMLVTLGLSGCGLFGGGDDEAAAPDGAPPEGADTAMDPAMEAAPPDDMGAPPPEGEPGAMPPEGTAPEGAPAGGGGDAASLVAEGMAAKHEGDYVTARARFEAAVAAEPDNADAHYGLAWVLAEMAASGQPNLKQNAIAEFQKFLELGGNQQQVDEATSALDRLQ